MDKRSEHSEQNGQGHAQSILELYQAHKALDEGAETAKANGNEYDSTDSVTEAATEDALEVSVRSDWHSPGDTENGEANEFRILLSTGGPAAQITGDLDEHGNPENPELQVQDWYEPWSVYNPVPGLDCDGDEWDKALAWFVSCFYFGE